MMSISDPTFFLILTCPFSYSFPPTIVSNCSSSVVGPDLILVDGREAIQEVGNEPIVFLVRIIIVRLVGWLVCG